jgi:hypothetical protein
MVLLNASSRSREAVRRSININQGGGSKKAGFPYQIGRQSWTSMFFDTCDPTSSISCCTLPNFQTPEDIPMIFVRNTGMRPGSMYGMRSPP